jgi:hypothetical protein
VNVDHGHATCWVIRQAHQAPAHSNRDRGGEGPRQVQDRSERYCSTVEALMAYLFRIAKSGSDWTTNELLAYNIRVSSQSPDSFYGQPLPTVASLSSLDPNLLSGTLGTQGLSDETYRLLQYLDLASRANSGQESAINDFAREILRALGYEKRGLLLRSRYAIPLLISGDPNRSAQTDVAYSGLVYHPSSGPRG